MCLLILVYYWILIARAIISFIPNPPDVLRPVYRLIYDLTEPVLRLVRPLIPPIRMGAMAMDLSPLLVFFVLIILQGVVC